MSARKKTKAKKVKVELPDLTPSSTLFAMPRHS